jgi:hypothetical protein
LPCAGRVFVDLGTVISARVPEVEGVGDECSVLAVNVDEDDERVCVLGATDGAGLVKVAVQWVLGTVIQLNLNSSTVSGSPVIRQ